MVCVAQMYQTPQRTKSHEFQDLAQGNLRRGRLDLFAARNETIAAVLKKFGKKAVMKWFKALATAT
jgi:hypothetical protein